MNANIFEPHEVMALQPPTLHILPSGTMLKTVAVHIDEEYEQVPVGQVMVAPTAALNLFEIEMIKQRGGPLPNEDRYPPGTFVISIVNTKELGRQLIKQAQPWYKRSAEKQVRRAEAKAIQAIFERLDIKA